MSIRTTLAATALAAVAVALPAAAQPVVAITDDNTVLVIPNATTPSVTIPLLSTPLALADGETLVGLDSRAATRQIYLLAYDRTTGAARMYVLSDDATSIVPVGSVPVTLDLGSGVVGFDYNPTVDRFRVVGSNGANYRLHPTTGALAATDGMLNYAPDDPNAGAMPMVGACAYTNSVPGTTSTTLYGFDAGTASLVTQNPPNAGVLNTVGVTGLTLDPMYTAMDMDIVADPVAETNTVILSANPSSATGTHLYAIDRSTGMATDLGAIGDGTVRVQLIAGIANQGQAMVTGSLLFVLADNGTQLVTIDSDVPTPIRNGVTVVGLAMGESLVGIDVRPNTSELWGLGYDADAKTAHLYVIDPSTGIATQQGASAITLDLGTGSVGFDFNPAVDRIRVVAANGMNYRLNPLTGGLAATDGTLAFAPGDPNAGTMPMVGACAYTNSYIASEATALYGYDEALNVLVTQNPPNAGTLNTVGASGITINRDRPSVDMDIVYDRIDGKNVAMMVANVGTDTTDHLYTIDLETGAATDRGRIGAFGFGVRDIAAFIDNTFQEDVAGDLLVALTRSNTNLLTLASGRPFEIRSLRALSGIAPGQRIVGMDFRPATRTLYALGYDTAMSTATLYRLDHMTGAATAVNGTPMMIDLGKGNVGFDFNPTVDRIRVVSASGRNYRLNPNDGSLAATDGNLAYAINDPMNGTMPDVGSVAYVNSFAGATTTTLFGIDDTQRALVTIAPPNDGITNTIAPLGIALNPMDRTTDIDFTYDSTSMTNRGYLVANAEGTMNDMLYTINGTESAAPVGLIGSGIPIVDIAAVLTFSGLTTGVDTETPSAGHAFLYPNPASDRTTLVLPVAPATDVVVDIVDAIGNRVASYPVTAGTDLVPVSVAALAPGAHTAVVRTGTTTTAVRFMVTGR